MNINYLGSRPEEIKQNVQVAHFGLIHFLGSKGTDFIFLLYWKGRLGFFITQWGARIFLWKRGPEVFFWALQRGWANCLGVHKGSKKMIAPFKFVTYFVRSMEGPLSGKPKHWMKSLKRLKQ